MRGCVFVMILSLLAGCATNNSNDPNAPVLPPTADAHSGGADAALFAAKTY